MKIQNALNRLSTPFTLKSLANSDFPKKTVALKRRGFFLRRNAREDFPCLPWLSPELSKLKWSKLNDAYSSGTKANRVCSDKERAMLDLVQSALLCNKSIELMMVSFRKG